MALSARDLRAIEIYKRYHEKSLENNLNEYHHFLDLLISLHDVLAKEEIEIYQWEKLSEPLLLKFYLHGNTIYHIYRGTEMNSKHLFEQDLSIKIFDFPSAKVLQRAQLEAFLMYHHIYVNPKTDDEKQLRYYAWIYSSLLERQKFPENTNVAREVKAKDRGALNSIKEEILKLTSFKRLSGKQQEALIETGSKKLFKRWATIMEESGFPKDRGFSTLYNIMSSYAHSEGLGIMQLNDTNIVYNPNSETAYLDVHISKLLVCMMILAIKNRYKAVEIKYKSLPENTLYDIELYASLGAII